MFIPFLSALIAALTGAAQPQTASADTSVIPDAPHPWVRACENWDDWDKPGPPFHVHGSTWYVGTCGISAILVTGAEGHILIDGGTEAGAGLIADNILALGFEMSDIRILLHSHEHFDHVAGLAGLQQRSGARLLASAAAAPVLSTGEDAPSDPQFGLHDPFPAARVDGIVEDGDIIRLGNIALTAIATPGHTPGALSWQWESCGDEGCEMIVYADSLSPVSAADYRFSDHPAYLEAYYESLDKLSGLDCTLLLTTHPSAGGLRERLAAQSLAGPGRCRDYAKSIRNRLDKRLEEERSGN